MWSRSRVGITLLLVLHIVSCCVSLIFVAESITYQATPLFNKAHLFGALLSVASFSLVALLFTFSRFSFGYVLGFYFYTMILGYLWLLPFSGFRYDHSLAYISIFFSGSAFLAPALLITSPATQTFVLSARTFDAALDLILALATATVVAGALYNFRLASISDIYNFRQGIEFPGLLRYAIGIVSSALLPFAFAGFVTRGAPWRAAIALLLLSLLYPITLTKLALFAPCWLLFLMLTSRFVEARIVVVLSLLLPISLGIALVFLYKSGAISLELMFQFFGTVNVRMIALPSIAIDVYNDFFSSHGLTHFCQISILKPLVDCPYSQPLSILLAQTYPLGNLNASLFATEGIASVGPLLAPLSALACGLLIALGNRASFGLPPRFVLLSGGILPQIFLNVPLTTTLLTHGAALLFLLWYVTPRSIFERTERIEP